MATTTCSTAAAGNDTLNGGGGNDTLVGLGSGTAVQPVASCLGDDTLDGGPGNDRLDGDWNTAAGDELIGGPDIDRVLFSTCGSAATVTIDTDAASSNDDGCTDGSGDIASDDVHQDVESVTGTAVRRHDHRQLPRQHLRRQRATSRTSAPDGNDTLNGDPAGCLAATTDGTEADFMGGGEGNDTFNGDGSGQRRLRHGHLRQPLHGYAVSVGRRAPYQATARSVSPSTTPPTTATASATPPTTSTATSTA